MQAKETRRNRSKPHSLPAGQTRSVTQLAGRKRGESEQEHHEETGHGDEPDEEGKHIPCGSVRVATHHG